MNEMDRDMGRPHRLTDQHFGLGLTPEDMLAPLTMVPQRRMFSNYIRPWKNETTDSGSTVHVDKDSFRVDLDVQQFKPEEISVKVADGYVTVHGEHEEKEDEHGYISRRFTRRYLVPKDFDSHHIASKLSTDGILSISAPKMAAIENKERPIAITHTGEPHRSIKHADKAINGKK